MVQNRSKLTSAGALAFAFGTGLFLLIFPAGERVRHLAMVRDGNLAALPNALRHLCWIRKGQESLNETIPELPLDRRRAVLREARAQGCVRQLSPQIQASYFILEGEIAGGLEHAIAFERDAIGPGFEALESSDPRLRKRGVFVVATMSSLLTPAERDRAMGILERLPAGSERRLLAMKLRPEEDVPPDGEAWLSVDRQDEASRDDDADDAADLEGWDVPVRLEEPQLRVPRGGVLFQAEADAPEDEANTEQDVGEPTLDNEPESEDADADEVTRERSGDQESDAGEPARPSGSRPEKQPKDRTKDAKVPRAATSKDDAEPASQSPASDDEPTSDADDVNAEVPTEPTEGADE